MSRSKPFRLASDPGRSYQLPKGRVFCCTLSDGTESASMSDHFGAESNTRHQALLDIAQDLRDAADALEELAKTPKVKNHV